MSQHLESFGCDNFLMCSTTQSFSSTVDRAIEIDWSRMFEEHKRWLSTVIRSRLANETSAEDVLQEVALAVISQPNRPSDPLKVSAFLYRIAIRKIVNHHRSSGRRRRLAEDYAQASGCLSECTLIAPGEWMLSAEVSSDVQAALSKLPSPDRQLLLLKYSENWCYQQLADHLGISLKTVEYRLLRARNRLRNLLQPDE